MYFRRRVARSFECDRMVRSPRNKEYDMKISALMVVAGAAIVFAAPIANAATDTTHHSLPAHKVAKQGKTSNGKSSTKLGKSATSKTVVPRPPFYIVVPGFTGTSVASSDPVDQCAMIGVDCTDTQLCELFGENCSTAGAPSTDQTSGQSGDQSSASQPLATLGGSDEQSDASAATFSTSDAQDLAPASSWCELAFEGC
jgi:hypothetical protein